jgi:signal transduction histidine kinase
MATFGTTSRWVALLVMSRLLAAAAAVALFGVHRVTDYDGALVVLTLVWTAVSLLAYLRWPRLQGAPAAWAVDGAAALALVWLSGDWRSPFYVFMLTALVLPTTGLPAKKAILWGATFTGGYLVVALLTRFSERAQGGAANVETAATHLMVPGVVTLALAYASELLSQLRSEQRRAEHLAVQTERQRIAWELHDSAKQRVHAAHLVLTALEPQLRDGQGAVLDHALAELRAAAADMDTSVAELRAPLDGRPLADLLHDRARELQAATPATITVTGTLPDLPPLVAAHAYRIAAEALTNAVRHAGARRIAVELGPRAIVVRDDGQGLPGHVRPGASGLRSMANRAETIGADLELAPGDGGVGTTVTLRLPGPDGSPAADDRTRNQGAPA